MRKHIVNIANLFLIVCICFISISFLNENGVKAEEKEMPIYVEGKSNQTFVNITSEAVSKDELYITASIMQYDDGTYNIVILSSIDKEKWYLYSVVSDKVDLKPSEVSIRYLNGKYFIHEQMNNGLVSYISDDAFAWSSLDLTSYDFADLTFYNEKYWAVTSGGSVFYTKNLINWTFVCSLENNNDSEQRAIDIDVNDKVVVISHYATKWGATNYQNGLAIYDRTHKKWLQTSGYDNEFGVTENIIWTGDQFILSNRNVYDEKTPLSFYTSEDGVNWSLESSNKVGLLRQLNLLATKDSAINKNINSIKQQIEAYAASGGAIAVEVIMDGQKIEFDQNAILIDGRVLVPVRKIFEVLGGTVTWDAQSKTVNGMIADTSVELTIDQNKAFINGEATELDVTAKIINGRTYVPVRFIAQSCNVSTRWDGKNYQVYLTTK